MKMKNKMKNKIIVLILILTSCYVQSTHAYQLDISINKTSYKADNSKFEISHNFINRTSEYDTSKKNSIQTIYNESLEDEISCSAVSNVSNTNITSNSASFSWTPISIIGGAVYEIKYGTSGFDVNTSGTLVTIFLPNAIINGLTSETTYDFYVRTACGASNYSSWSTPVSITTLNEEGVGIIIDRTGNKFYSGSYRPSLEKKYILGAWIKEVKEGVTSQPPNYTNSEIGIYLVNVNDITVSNPIQVGVFKPSGKIIDGWQRVQGVFELNASIDDFINQNALQIQLKNTSSDVSVYFDDIRVFPFHGNMKSFVYDDVTKKLMAELDENNYATYYEYDNEGGLIRVKKETEKGIYTIQETRSSNAKKN